MDRELYYTLRLLRISGILGAAFPQRDGKIRLWIGDTTEGVRDTATLEHELAPAWLAERALRHYPSSDFAKVRRLLEGAIAAAARA